MGYQAGASATVLIDCSAVITGWLAPSTRARRGSVFYLADINGPLGVMFPGATPARADFLWRYIMGKALIAIAIIAALTSTQAETDNEVRHFPQESRTSIPG